MTSWGTVCRKQPRLSFIISLLKLFRSELWSNITWQSQSQSVSSAVREVPASAPANYLKTAVRFIAIEKDLQKLSSSFSFWFSILEILTLNWATGGWNYIGFYFWLSQYLTQWGLIRCSHGGLCSLPRIQILMISTCAATRSLSSSTNLYLYRR